MPLFHHDGLSFHYQEAGSGVPFVFQHGLGGDVTQPFGLYQPPAGVRLLGLDCRAHGQTNPLGDPAKVRLAAFADDIQAWRDHLGLERVVIGGISMGAAVALNFTLRFPDRVMGLVLSRPAWLNGPMQENARIFGLVAQLIRAHGAAGAELFKQSEVYRTVRQQSLDAAYSLLGQFGAPDAAGRVIRLEQIPLDAPNEDRAEWQRIQAPTLVMGSRQDPIHPFGYAEILGQLIPGAQFRELTPKSVSWRRYAKDTQTFIDDFLHRHQFPC